MVHLKQLQKLSDFQSWTTYNMANNSSIDSPMMLEEFSSGLPYLGLVVASLLLPPVFTVNFLLLVAINVEKTLYVFVRITLTNIVASSELVISGFIILYLNGIIQHILLSPTPSDVACRIAYVVLFTGAAARLLYMATYAVTVYVLARYAGTTLRTVKFKLWPVLLAVLVIWVSVTLLNLFHISDAFLKISFTSTYICIAHGNGAVAITYTFGYIIVYGVCCFVLSIIFPISTLRYIKKNCITENKQTLHNMIKFSIFLLIGNVINLIGVSLPLLLATFSPVGEEYHMMLLAFNFVEGITFMLSLIPTPIIILIFFKPIRIRLKKITCFMCLQMAAKKDRQSQPSRVTTSNTVSQQM